MFLTENGNVLRFCTQNTLKINCLKYIYLDVMYDMYVCIK